MNIINKILFITVAVAFLFCPPSFAQEDDLEFTFGYITSVKGSQIVLEEYDFDTDETKEVVYTTDKNTTFKNVDSVDDLEEYDEVDIDYAEKNGEKVVVSLSKKNTEYDEGEDYGTLETEEPYAPLGVKEGNAGMEEENNLGSPGNAIDTNSAMEMKDE